MTEKFKQLSKTRQCLLVGRIARMYDAGYTIEEIKETLNKHEDLVEEIVDMIIKTREKSKLSK